MCYNVKRMCIKSSPQREGSNHRDTPIDMMTKLRHNDIGTNPMLQPYILH